MVMRVAGTIFRLILVCFFINFPGIFVFAATPPGSMQQIEQEQQRIQQEQQRLMDMERRRQEVEQAIRRPHFEEPVGEALPSLPDGGGCIEINELYLSGNTVFSERRINDVFAPYKGQCLSLARINSLLQDITNLYLNAGYITSRAFVSMPQNRLKDGILEIHIVEGRISRIDGIERGERWTAFPGIIDEVLNLRDIEQGLEQMNRLASNGATMEIKPSEDKDGYSDVAINNTPQGRLRVSAFTDNSGSESTGEWRVGGRINAENILRLNEQFYFNYVNSPSHSPRQRDSNSYSGSLSIPYGYWTCTYNLSKSDYRTSFLTPVSKERFYYYGDSLSHNVTVDRIIGRGQNYKASVAAGLTYKNNRNYSKIADLTLKNEASSRTLTILNLELPATFYLPNSVLYLKPGIYQGLRWFGALNDSEEVYSQRAQYSAFKLYGYHSFRWGFSSFTTALDVQITRHELFSSEAFFIGGEGSVRGFRDDSIQGDKGFTLRNDVSFDLNRMFGTEAKNKFLAMFTPGLFIDYGFADSNSAYMGQADLASAGAKCAFDWEFIQASATYAAVLHKEDWMRDNAAWYLYAGINFTF